MLERVWRKGNPLTLLVGGAWGLDQWCDTFSIFRVNNYLERKRTFICLLQLTVNGRKYTMKLKPGAGISESISDPAHHTGLILYKECVLHNGEHDLPAVSVISEMQKCKGRFVFRKNPCLPTQLWALFSQFSSQSSALSGRTRFSKKLNQTGKINPGGLHASFSTNLWRWMCKRHF